MTNPFNVMATFWFARDRLFRVYADSDTLYFIRIGGQFAYKDIKDLHANPLGGGLAYAVKSSLAAAERIMAPEDIAVLDRSSPRSALGQHQHNMAIPLANIASATLVPPPLISLHGRNFGRWLLHLNEGATQTFQFMEIDEMQTALVVLPALLQDKLQVKVRWEPARAKFVAAG
jgi:hypothetical protein